MTPEPANHTADAAAFDIEHLTAWIGRRATATEQLSERVATELRATFGWDRDRDGYAPPGAIWCLFPPDAATPELGPDGHPAKGGFLPPVPLPRRMWAGGHVEFADRLKIGDVVTRRSTIADVKAKSGRSGSLCFVTIDHEYETARGLAIRERQDIVYRAPDPDAAGQSRPSRPTGEPEASHEAEASEAWFADPVLLFRYSAITFNSHRIHYDRDYAVGEEGYSGLVVHGPLQATLLLDLAARTLGRPVTTLSFRGVRALTDRQHFRVCANQSGSGLLLFVVDQTGAETMSAQAS